MKFPLALPLVLLLLAPAAPAAEPPAAPVPATVEALRASMLASDSILVTRIEVEESVTTDSLGQPHTSVNSKRIALNNVKGPWMKRFVANFLPEGATLRPELCTAPVGAAGLAKPWMLSALWISKQARGQAYVNLLSGCGFAGIAGGKPAGLDIGAHTDSLLALFQQALFADSAFATVRAASLPDTTPVRKATVAETQPEVIERIAPAYPDSARAAGIEGTVTVKALVGSGGRVMRVEIQDGVPALDAAAMAAVKQWRFKPATADGKPRAVWVSIPVSFKLSPGEPGKPGKHH